MSLFAVPFLYGLLIYCSSFILIFVEHERGYWNSFYLENIFIKKLNNFVIQVKVVFITGNISDVARTQSPDLRFRFLNLSKFMPCCRQNSLGLSFCFPLAFILLPHHSKHLPVNDGNTRKRCEICSKLTVKTPERRH